MPHSDRATPGTELGLLFRRADRIRKAWEFRFVQRDGKRVHTPHFVLIVYAVTQPPRLGLTVSKKVSAKAVHRNRIKRLLREVWRTNRALFPEACDVVVIAKRGAEGLGYADVLAEVTKAQRALHGAAHAFTRSAP